MIKHHAPVHEQVLFTEESWKRSALYVHGCGLQYNHEHAMTGPIVGHGQLIGMVHFARTSGYPAFDAKDLANLSALCAHLSATKSAVTCSLKATYIRMGNSIDGTGATDCGISGERIDECGDWGRTLDHTKFR